MVYRLTHAIRSTSGLRHLAAALAVLAFLTVSPINAGAIVLPPGGAVVPPSTLAAPGAFVDDLSSNFVLPDNSAAGILLSEVWQVAGGGYDFYYQVATSTSAFPPFIGINVLTNTPYENNVITDVFFRSSTAGMTGTGLFTPTAGLTVPTISRPAGTNELRINFFPAVSTGALQEDNYSPIVVVRTNATQYFTGNGRLDGPFTSANVGALAPIPEPGSLLLLGSGLAGLAGLTKLRRRRQRANI